MDNSEWNIEKIGTLTMDNASANDVVARCLQDHYSSRRMLIKECIHRVRNAVKYVKASPKRKLEFIQYADQERIPKGSFAGLGFLALYLSGKIQAFDSRGHVAKLCIVFLPLLVAALVGISRVDVMDAVIEMSRRLGFLTGSESEIMLEAHVQAGFVVGLPGFDFRSTNITQNVSSLEATMLMHRVTAPPDEAYSLHRKLSGAFLTCIKLGAVVPCRELLLDVYDCSQFDEDGDEILSSGSHS
ncbi:hypothetical protein RJ641_030703 [Dillenia turbinata]|uniref:Uncharacterized protein n=1 Tax=Dillenia turbinata TaxID=194707 RepID=A0AAN8W8H7_9MAGN